MKEKILEKISLGVSLLPLTFFIIRHLRIGMEAPWVYIFFAAYAVLIIVGFVFAICLIKNKKTRNAISKAALAISSVYLAFFSFHKQRPFSFILPEKRHVHNLFTHAFVVDATGQTG